MAELLILRPDMPRSLAACMNEVVTTCSMVANEQSGETLRRAGRLHADLQYGRIDEILATGLHAYLTQFLDRVERPRRRHQPRLPGADGGLNVCLQAVVRITERCSVPLSGSHTSPGRPRIWRTLRPRAKAEALELLARRIEAQHRVAAEVADPDRVALVDVDGVGARVRRPAASMRASCFAAGSCTDNCPQFHSLTQMRPRLSLQTRRAPWFCVGGSTTIESPVVRSMRAMNEPASEHHHTSPRRRGADAVRPAARAARP